MKVLDFLCRDFGRKLIALIFAVVIYWQVDRSMTQNDVPREAQRIDNSARVDAVRIVDLGADRRVSFAEGVKPEVKVTLYGATKSDLADVKDGDVLFYVVAGKELKPGEHTLPVSCYCRRSGIGAHSIEPAKMKITIVEDPVENRK